MLDQLLMQAVSNVTGNVTGGSAGFAAFNWNIIDGILIALIAGMGMLAYWLRKARTIIAAKVDRDEARGIHDVMLKKVLGFMDELLPILDNSTQIATNTANQEVKIKQGLEILYGFMGPDADKISGKEQVKLANLAEDVKNTTKVAVSQNEKVKEFVDLINSLKLTIGKIDANKSGAPIS